MTDTRVRYSLKDRDSPFLSTDRLCEKDFIWKERDSWKNALKDLKGQLNKHKLLC